MIPNTLIWERFEAKVIYFNTKYGYPNETMTIDKYLSAEIVHNNDDMLNIFFQKTMGHLNSNFIRRLTP